MMEIYECGQCGVVTEDRSQVCEPQGLSDKNAYCGTAPERGTMCQEMQEQLPFVCDSCGRPAEQAELVCNPRVLG